MEFQCVAPNSSTAFTADCSRYSEEIKTVVDCPCFCLAISDFLPLGDIHFLCVPSFDPIGELARPKLWKRFIMYELHEIMTQKRDAAFAVALNHMADETDSVRCQLNSVKMYTH